MEPLQRIRLTYSQGEELRQSTQRDLAALWAQACAASGIVLAHNEDRRPEGRIAFAARLPAGATSDREFADIETAVHVCDDDLILLLPPHLPPGLRLLAAREVGRHGPAISTLARWSEYLVEAPDRREEAAVRKAIEGLLSAETLPWEQAHEKRVSRYDLRPLVMDLALEEAREGAYVLRMRLRHTNERAGRPEQVTLALGFSEAPTRLHRTQVYLSRLPEAIQRQREQGDESGW